MRSWRWQELVAGSTGLQGVSSFVGDGFALSLARPAPSGGPDASSPRSGMRCAVSASCFLLFSVGSYLWPPHGFPGRRRAMDPPLRSHLWSCDTLLCRSPGRGIGLSTWLTNKCNGLPGAGSWNSPSGAISRTPLFSRAWMVFAEMQKDRFSYSAERIKKQTSEENRPSLSGAAPLLSAPELTCCGMNKSDCCQRGGLCLAGR